MHAFSSVEIKKLARGHFDRSLLVSLLIVAALITALFAEFYLFARAQDIWLDESTQLSGITLKFWEMLRWLSGADPDRLGVPGDRMPPISYALDWLWLRLYGSSEIGFRLFHSAIVIAGISYLAAVTWRELGRGATIAWLGFLVLSPKLIQTGVEIRAYPIFFAVTCVQTAVFMRLLACPKKTDLRLLAAFVVLCLLAIYTHFYGVVSSCAFFLALGIAFIRTPAALAEIIGAFVVVAVGSLGLVPFTLGAAEVSRVLFVPETATAPVFVERSIVQCLTYLLKLPGDSANMVSVPASLLFFSGTIALLLASVFAALTRARIGKSKPVDWCIVVLASGILVTMAAGFFVSTRTLDALKASYSVWLLVPLSLLIGTGATSVIGFRLWDVAGRTLAVSALFVGAGMSTYTFLDHASMFVHGPNRFVGALYDKALAPKAIVYEAGAAWGWSYVPLQYSHHGEVVQYRASDDGGGLVRSGPRSAEATAREMEATVAPYKTLLLTDVRLRTYRDLRQCMNRPSACPDFPPATLQAALIGTGKWREIGKERAFGLWDSEVTILERSEN
jgi:hypothetical protein